MAVGPLYRASRYHCFDLHGAREFPTAVEVAEAAKLGVRTALVLDASVCLDLATFYRGRGKEEERASSQILLMAIMETRVDVVPFPGCIELASPLGHPETDTQKLWSFGTSVYSALNLDRDQVLRTKAKSPPQDTQPDGDWESKWRSPEPVYPLIRWFYAAMLKIIELRARPDRKKNAIKNIVAFSEWCERMRCHVALAREAAIALLGGSDDAVSLLGITKKKGPLRAAWGTAWDLTHAWLVQNCYSTLRIDGARQHPIFVTADRGAAFVAGRCLPRAALTIEGAPFLTVYSIADDFPYLVGKAEELGQALDRVEAMQLLRLATAAPGGPRADHRQVNAEITHLETTVGELFPTPG